MMLQNQDMADKWQQLQLLRARLTEQASQGQEQEIADMAQLTQLEKELGIGCLLDLEDIGER